MEGVVPGALCVQTCWVTVGVGVVTEVGCDFIL